MAMSRKRARHLMLELARRIHKNYYGNLKGFGKTARFYSDDWRHLDYKSTGGYKASWNSEIIRQLRDSVGM